jgi:hypothetical protein
MYYIARPPVGPLGGFVDYFWAMSDAPPHADALMHFIGRAADLPQRASSGGRAGPLGPPFW